MTHTIVVTKVSEGILELDDSEYEEFVKNPWDYINNVVDYDTVERSYEEYDS